jgi:hypothetical protein
MIEDFGGVKLGELPPVFMAYTDRNKSVIMNSRDKVEQHLIQQKARAVNGDGSACMYRSAGGLMCAAGCLIPDEKYSPALERRAIKLLIAAGFEGIFPSDISVEELKLWQDYHDGVLRLNQNDDFFWGYQRWIDGNEGHHPSLFKKALADVFDAQAVAA